MKVNAEKLYFLMAEKMLSKQDLGEKSKLSHSAISRSFKGKTVTPKTIGKIAKALDVPVRDIVNIGGENDED